ncbi:MAG TPA: DapH/DapD/GlmU-related protein, partial [Bacteroidia bacterium]|nr:DapH/DapD/GlmU-related protein [Bacteroidia bacterium]
MQLKVRIIFRLVELNLLPEFIKLKLVRSIWSVGKDFKIGKNSFIFSNNVFIGHNVTIGDNVIIRANEVKIGNDTFIYKDTSITATVKVHIGDECVIAENVIVGGGQRNDSSFSMGKRVHVYPFCYLNTTRPLILEDGVGIGGGTYIFTHGSWQDAYEGFPFVYAPVTIKKNAWLPWRVFVMPGVTIGEEATI